MALFKFGVEICCWCLIFSITCHQLQGSPITSKQPVPERQSQLFQEMLCLLKGKAVEECISDNNVGYIMNALLQSPSNNDDSEEEAQLDEKSAQLAHLLPLNLAANKRDAFYSDWRRRRR